MQIEVVPSERKKKIILEEVVENGCKHPGLFVSVPLTLCVHFEHRCVCVCVCVSSPEDSLGYCSSGAVHLILRQSLIFV